MTTEKIRQIIAEEQQQNERNAETRAKTIIKEIVQCQARIQNEMLTLVKFREELKNLTVPTIDETQILGG